MVKGASGEFEATSHLQINWRRVKRKYFEVYLFRSAVTANSKVAMRRASVFITALLVATGRFRVCRQGMGAREVEAAEGGRAGVPRAAAKRHAVRVVGGALRGGA